MISRDLKIKSKKGASSNPLDFNNGLIKRNFVSKYIRLIPSVVIWSLDWREIPEGVSWNDLETALLSEYNQHREMLNSRNIKLIFIILIPKNLAGTIAQEEINQALKKSLDLEQKQLFINSEFPDFLSQIRKK